MSTPRQAANKKLEERRKTARATYNNKLEEINSRSRASRKSGKNVAETEKKLDKERAAIRRTRDNDISRTRGFMNETGATVDEAVSRGINAFKKMDPELP